MSQANTLIAQRLSIQAELQKKEQFICPANQNHQLTSLDRQKCHINTCREIKNMGPEVVIYFCQFYEGHMYMLKGERDQHELNCAWKDVPGNQPYSSTANRHITLRGGSKTAQPQNPVNQQKHYQYALMKGFVKPKQSTQVSEEDFVFVREPNRINLELEKQHQLFQTDYDPKHLLTLVDRREDTDLSQLEFGISSQQLEMFSLAEWIRACLQHGLPFNSHFRDNHTITLEKRNEYQDFFKNLTLSKTKFEINYFIPASVISNLFEGVHPLNRYEDYLNLLVTEVKVRTPQDKFQKEFMNVLHETTQFHPKYKMNSGMFNISLPGIVTLIVPRNHCRSIKRFASVYTDLVILSVKLKSFVLIDIFKPFVHDQNKLSIWKESTNMSSTKHSDFQDTINESKIEMIDETEESDTLERLLLLKEIDLYDQYISNYNDRMKLKQQQIENQKHQTKEARQQVESLGHNSVSLDSQQKEQENRLRVEFRNLKRKIRTTQQQLFDEVIREFEDYKFQLTETMKTKLEEATNLENQIITFQQNNNKRQEGVQKLEQRLRRKEREIQTQNKLPISQSGIIDDTQAFQYHVRSSILCKLCEKNKINVLFVGCNHAILCQTCYEAFNSEGHRHCLYCEQAYQKVKYILWENGYSLGQSDVLVQT